MIDFNTFLNRIDSNIKKDYIFEEKNYKNFL